MKLNRKWPKNCPGANGDWEAGLNREELWKYVRSGRAHQLRESTEMLGENINSRRRITAEGGERRKREKKATTFGSSWKFVYTTLSRTVMHYALETDWPEIFGLCCSSRRNSITTRHSGTLSTDLSDILCVPEE